MTQARNLTGAERCSLFLVDKRSNELVAKVFDVADEDEQIVSEPEAVTSAQSHRVGQGKQSCTRPVPIPWALQMHVLLLY